MSQKGILISRLKTSNYKHEYVLQGNKIIPCAYR